jgi:hypothetical protein
MQKLPTDENQTITEWMQKFEQDQARPIFLKQLKPVTFKAFTDYLLEHSGEDTPHIIHFDGHGCFGILCNNTLPDGKVCRTFHFNVTTTQCRVCHASLQGPQGYLLFENEAGGADYISAEDIGWRIGEANRSNSKKQGILLVVLSACKSSLALVEDSVFNGVAQSLIHQQIPAVIGMSFSVTASSATGFAERFYRALAQRHPLALATNWGRSRMGEIAENQWYRPALARKKKSGPTNVITRGLRLIHCSNRCRNFLNSWIMLPTCQQEPFPSDIRSLCHCTKLKAS